MRALPVASTFSLCVVHIGKQPEKQVIVKSWARGLNQNNCTAALGPQARGIRAIILIQTEGA